jgi:hypothetical protein
MSVCEYRLLKKIFGLERDEVRGGWRKLRNKELCNFYLTPSIIRMIKSRRIRWARYVTRMGTGDMHVCYWWEKPEGKETTRKSDLY